MLRCCGGRRSAGTDFRRTSRSSICAPSHAQSIRLKKLAQEGVLDDQTIYAVLAETKPNQQEQLKFKREELRKYFPSGYTEEQMRRDIIKGLELLKRQRERNRDAR